MLLEAAAVLLQGGLVIYPTETVYGLGCLASNQAAVSRLLKVKNRPAGKAVSVLVANIDAARELVEIDAPAQQVFERFLPGPVTVVCKDKGVVDSRLASEFGTLGIRISSHSFPQALAERVGPITATSANPAGKARPYDPEHFLQQFSDEQLANIDLFVDAGKLPKREPSTVIDTTGPVQTVLRAGADVSELSLPVETADEETTQRHGATLLRQFQHVLAEKPLIFALEGDMGMGKTQLAKGIGQALGVSQIINSPTYSLMKEYDGELGKLIHLDLWRAADATAEELALSDYYHPRNVVVVEWATPLLAHFAELADQAVVVRLEFSEREGKRTIKHLAL